jgi:flagellar biosynthesis chaperone FliJ
MNAQTVIGIACFAIMSSGCIMKSTYDAAVQETDSYKVELERAREEQRLYAKQVKELEQSNKDTMQDAEATLTATMRAQTDMEAERRLAEEQEAKLKQKIAQLIRQHHAMREELAVARENSAALQELVEVYKRKVAELPRDIVASSSPNTTPASKPFDPALLPPVQDLPPPAPAVEPSKPAPVPAPATPPVPAKHKPEPAESGWLTTIKEWVVSLWRSIFS